MERLLRIFLVVAMYVAEISAVSASPILTLTDGPEAAYSDLLSSLHTQLEAASIASMDEIIVLDNVAGQSIAEVEARIHEIAGLRPEGILLALGPAAYEYAHEMIIRGKFPPARCIAVLYAVSAHELPPTSVGRRIVVQVPVSRDRSLIASDFGLDSLTLLVDDTAADWQVAGLEDMPVVRFDPNQPGTVPNDSGGVYLFPLIHTEDRQRSLLYRSLSRRGIAVFSAGGPAEVSRGALASYAPDLGQAIAREITLTIEEADAHMNLSDRDILITTNPQLTFNPSVTDSAGVALSWRTVLLANTTGETSVDHVLKLADVIDDAVQNNADLEADRAAVAVRQFAVDNAKSALRPRVEAFANGTAIDEDRAESFGTPDQYESSLGVRVQRLLWSEPARANVRIQELLSDAQNQYFIEKRSDTIAAVAETFYQLAAASSLVRIQRDNINRTRAYLDQARLLAQVGKESRADVYRFESRLAEDNRALIDAYAGARLLRLRLDEYRGTMAPLITPSLVLLEITEADGNSTYAEELIRNAATVQATRRLEEFVIQSARNNSALSAAAQRQLAVRSREVQSRSRSLYSPTISAFTEVEYTWYKGGATGSSETQLAPGVTFDSSTLNTADDMNWRAGISVTLPVYTGGERIATLRQARSAEEQAMNELRSTESIVENRARVAVTNLVSSCNSLQEARTSVRSAGLGLELIEEAYRTGAADSLELLDGQNTVRIAEQRAATTEADFRVAWVRLLHATGRIEALTSTQEARRFVRAAEQAMGTK